MISKIERIFSIPFETTWDNLVHATEHEDERNVTTLLRDSSIVSLCHSLSNSVLDIFSLELQRVLESLLDQVDWLKVAVKAAKHRAPSIYCNAIEKIVLAQIYQLIKAEGQDDEVRSSFKNDNSGKEYMCMHEHNDEGEDGSEFSRDSEGKDRDCGENDDNYSLSTSKYGDSSDDEYEDDEMNEDEYGEDSE
ncbi:MAG: hypothetical protein Q9191_005656 [Dirinaria sp. TL-2023a]